MNATGQQRVTFLAEQGATCYTTGDFPGAILNYTEAIKLDPTQATLYKRRGDVYLAMGADRHITLADYNRAIVLDPDYAEAYYRRGLERGALGEFSDALVDLLKAALLNPTYFPTDNHPLHDYADIILGYTRNLQEDPELPMVYFWRAVAQHGVGNYDAALADFTEALKFDTQDQAAIYFARGFNFEASNAWASAVADYDAALAINHDFQAAYTQREALQNKL